MMTSAIVSLSCKENLGTIDLQSIFTFCWSIILVTLIVSFGLYFGTEISGYNPETLSKPVNRAACTCDCWDGFFRGVHARGGYKTFYFNYELQTALLLAILLFYTESLRYFIIKLFTVKQINLLLLLLPIYSNYYGIWNIINYINDHDYDRMLPSQAFFSITELFGTYIFYQCLLREKTSEIMKPSMIYLLLTLSSLHLFLASSELNVPRLIRNIALILSDLIPVSWSILSMITNVSLRPDRSTTCFWFFIGFSLWLFYHFVSPYRD